MSLSRWISSLQGRLTITYLVLITAATTVLGFGIYRWTADDLIAERRIRLLTEARIVADAVGPFMPGDQNAALHTLETLGRRYEARLLLIDPDMEVFGDSLHLTQPERSLLSTSFDIPEVRGALDGDAEAGVYRLRTGEYVLYASAPVVRGGTVTGAVLVSGSLAAVMGALSQLVTRLITAAVVINAAFLVVTWLTARRLTAPLESLTSAARRVGSGDLDTRVKVNSEDELGQLAGTFNRMAEQVQEHDTAQRRFISDASHELRSPISSAILIADALESGAPGSEVLLESLREQLERMSRLVNQLLELARLDEWTDEAGDAGAGDYADLAHVVNRIHRRMKPVAEAQGVDLESDVSGGPLVAGSEENLERVLQNIIENGIKYTPEGGSVTVTARRQESPCSVVTVDVRDTGPGIPRELLPHLFERFYRADAARSREEGGFGLGLAIARRRALAMGADITVDSTEGRGTCFTITIPLQPGTSGGNADPSGAES